MISLIVNRKDKMQTSKEQVTPYVTRDGSEVRELMHPEIHGNRNQSLAEATIRPGCTTRLHKHQHSEELYHVVSGTGWMTLGGKVFPVVAGDTICIAPDVVHRVENTDNQDLIILCCCAPPYSHADTELL